MELTSFFLGKAITLVPKILLGVILIIAALRYFRISRFANLKYKQLIWAAISVRALYALYQTFAQYVIWKGNGFTQLLLTLPVEPGPLSLRFLPFTTATGGYFIFYSFSRFWLNLLIAVFISWIFYKFLKILERRNSRFFEEGEPFLGFLAAIAVGWPGFVPFLVLIFFSLVLISAIKMLFFKDKYTTMGPAFLLAATLVLLFEPYFIGFFDLGVLRI